MLNVEGLQTELFDKILARPIVLVHSPYPVISWDLFEYLLHPEIQENGIHPSLTG